MPEAPKPPKSHSFGAALRLHGLRDFAAVFDAQLKKNLGPITLFSKPNTLGHPRLGLSVPRRVGNAVQRNRIKRLIREAFRLTQHDWPQGYDVIAVVRPHRAATLVEYQSLFTAAITSTHADWQRRLRRTTRGNPVDDAPAPKTNLTMLSRLFITLVLLYRATLGHFMGGHCRFHPSCSQYMIDAIQKYGPWRSAWRGLKRITRCHPWGGSGFDPA